ncbi:MAG: ATP-binding protein [Bacteroidia bacterium]|nr:ATP-binding protein [Bacteroidia bacterium]
MLVNPFLITGYYSPDYFCDREKELNLLKKNIGGKNNTTLISPRRLGKSGLILRLFDDLKKEGNYSTLYVDIFATRNIEDFIKAITDSILKEFPEHTSVGRKFWNFIKGIRPIIRFDQISGLPQVEITYQNEAEKTETLRSLWQFLENQDKPVVIAIDEFQQIREYPQSNMEAILRTEIQHLHNVVCIFSGSKRNMMIDIFSNTKKPFYNSTSFLNLEKIDRKVYADFINFHFLSNNYTISKDDIFYILEFTEGFTYHTQKICNKLYENRKPDIVKDDILLVINELLNENNIQYAQIKELLTTAQWNYLIAIAKGGKIQQPTAQEFIMKYKIGTPANSRRLLKALIDKDLILENLNTKWKDYQLYDVFLKHWLIRNY